jgi:hypothetical protein
MLANIMRENSDNFQASILDKLIDNEPQNPSESVASRMVSLSDIEASVTPQKYVAKLIRACCETKLFLNRTIARN